MPQDRRSQHLPERRPFTVFLTTSENLGLSTTLRNIADLLGASRQSVLLVDGRTGTAPAEPVPPPEPGAVHAVRRSDAAELAALADDPVAAGYDHVLIEAPVPDTAGAAEPAALAALADSFVVCFALSAWSIDGAGALAEELSRRTGERTVRVLALGLQSNIGVGDRLRDARERVRRRFGTLAQARGETAGIPFLEIPFNPLYQDSQELAADTETALTVAGIMPYYAQVADWLRRAEPRRLTEVRIVHTSAHAPWAAWLDDRLRGRGIGTTLLRSDRYGGERPGPGQALLFLSPGADPALLPKIGPLSHTDVRIVLVDEPYAHAETSHHERIDLRGKQEEAALQALYAGLAIGPAAGPEPTPAARFPQLPTVSNVVSRNGSFVDRAPLLADLDRSLRESARLGRPLVLHAPSGWGKSEAARELCHQYGPGYDVVWWVRAWERPRVRRGLTALADRLAATAHGGAGSGAGRAPDRDTDSADDTTTGTDPDAAGAGDGPAARRLLRRLSDPASRAGRWLIVFDGVERPEDLASFLPEPHEHGHVLITSRAATADGAALRTTDLPLRRMTQDEARALLGERTPDLTADDAAQIAAVLDGVPMALRLAASCLAERVAHHQREGRHDPGTATGTAVRDVLDTFRSAKAGLLTRADAASSIQVMVKVARLLAQDTPGASAWQHESPGRDALGWLLNAASLLTGRGMGLELLRTRRILSELGRDDLSRDRHATVAGRPRHVDDVQLPDEHMVSVALWSLARVGLLDVDFDRTAQPLTQHHVLRDVVRDGMSAHEREDVEMALRGALAEYVPHENQDLSREWAREVYALRMWEDERPRVRRSLLRHLNALSQRMGRADLARLLDVAEQARARWESPGDDQSPEYLRLLNFIARAHRLRGDHAAARSVSEAALRGHRRLLGLLHPRTLLSADSHAAILRALGRFDDALLQSRPAVEGLALLLGPRHAATAQAEHNLALTEALTGRYDVALALLQDRFRHRQAVGGKDDPGAWVRADLLAYLHRAVGRDQESRDLLRQYLRRNGQEWDGARLSVEVGLAISERRIADAYPVGSKDPRYGFERAYARDLEALERYLDEFGSRRLETLRCRFSLAADLHALGKHEDAELHARTCLDALTVTLGPRHPYTALGRVRHGVYLRALGRADDALDTGRSAVDTLRGQLGWTHPWAAAAENSLAATHAAAGRREEALQYARSAVTRLDDLGMSGRPLGRRVRDHLATLREEELPRAAPPTGFDIDLELPGL
ncbi:tetratricopeptide repeat protein [Streptomyces sp. SID5785]|uniref:FxSxx-COOH system tetratricopeptide repeat protein n=1 Tax=Streptomyces sp. SID5785 TaxID=2690309 RepID=UPI001361B403|nr:FxSxx-COOH system tetratricopeptide repeat protein [Streptomyces sp. SID5785]MZD03709.1 tetratricopeptide repeat protein [Streptomyces sp. SID5785]